MVTLDRFHAVPLIDLIPYSQGIFDVMLLFIVTPVDIVYRLFCHVYLKRISARIGLFLEDIIVLPLNPVGQCVWENGFDVLDTHAETVEYYDVIYGRSESEFNDTLLSLLNDDIFLSNLLIIDRLEILPSYRGRNLGLIIMRRLIQRFSWGVGVIAIKPFPLQLNHIAI